MEPANRQLAASEVLGESTGRQAIELFTCRFDEKSDVDWDNWPDGWTRQHGKGFPAYIRMGLEPVPEPGMPPVRDRTFVVHMNGGNAMVSSPSMRVSKSFSYVLICRLRLEQLEGFDVAVSLTTYDSQGQQIERIAVAPSAGDDRWQTVQLGPWALERDESQRVVIRLEITSTRPDALSGAVYWDDIQLMALPRLLLGTDQPLPYYREGTVPRLRCRVSGLRQANGGIDVAVYDAWGGLIAQEALTLQLQPMSSAPDLPGQASDTLFEGIQTWQIPVREPGFYRVEARVRGGSDEELKGHYHLAVVHDTSALPRQGIFGWAFPTGSHKLTLRQVAQLAGLAGLSWVKYPVWFGEKQTTQGDELASLAERLGVQGIELVGVLDNPPPDKRRELLGEMGWLPAALVFRDPEVWKPLLNPVMTRLSLKVRWWQLGADDDTSHSGYAQMESQVRAVTEHFERFGQEPRLVVPWNWLDPKPDAARAPWAALSYYVRPPFTSQELAGYLEHERQAGRSPWILLEPLDNTYHLETRVAELVRSMVIAQCYNVAGAFVPNPFDPSCGLLAPDGSPRELFVPWHTAVSLLGDTTYLGKLNLLHGSSNFVFLRGGQAMIAMWNDQPTQERLYVGGTDPVEIYDVWGRRQSVQPDGDYAAVTVPVGPVPVFAVGRHASIIRWQLEFSLDKTSLPTGVDNEQVLEVRFTNTFEQGVSGEMTVHAPSSWAVPSQRMRFMAAPGENVQLPVRVLLRSTSTSGPQPLRFDFQVHADQVYRFQVLRTVHVGDDQVTFHFSTAFDDHGNLVLEQQCVNSSQDTVSFSCMLLIPSQGRQRRQILYLGPGRRLDYYVIPNGASLVGQSLWLRATEIGGKGRSLNYEVPINR